RRSSRSSTIVALRGLRLGGALAGGRLVATGGQLLEPALQLLHPLAQGAVLVGQLAVAVLAAEERIRAPPAHAELLGLVGGGEQVPAEVAGDHEALVEHALEDVGEAGAGGTRREGLTVGAGGGHGHSSDRCALR